MRDKVGDHEDRIDAIFSRLHILESKIDIPEICATELEDLKEEVKRRIIDFDFRLNELELNIEGVKQYKKPRKKNG